ncbi:MAG: rRNA pseudouridine synthase [Alphaproteobacteria bacterium]|nr:rRNA pseudouridine synthase [Alphaproteobacteria bacterium]
MENTGQSKEEKKERIAKVMARAGLCSRREAERWIEAGRVSVNGEILTTPAVTVGAQDKILVDDKELQGQEKTRLFLYHKSAGFVTTAKDEQGRKTIFDDLPPELPRVISVGRLDINTEGLLLLTNDGELSRYLELPQNNFKRCYRVRAYGHTSQNQLDKLKRGITIEGIRYKEIEATLDKQQGDNVWIDIAITEGKNREVRKIMEAVGLQVNRLIRVSYGPFHLGKLPKGAVMELKHQKIKEFLPKFFK